MYAPMSVQEPLRAFIVYASPEGFIAKLAYAVSQGCHKSGAASDLLDLKEQKGLANYPWFGRMRKAESIPADLTPYSLVFIGFETGSLSESRKAFDFIESNSWSGKNVALFCSFESRKKALEEAVSILQRKGATIVNTLSLRRKGLISQKLEETDLARADAFGERCINNITGHRVSKNSDKARIEGYLKPGQ